MQDRPMPGRSRPPQTLHLINTTRTVVRSVSMYIGAGTPIYYISGAHPCRQLDAAARTEGMNHCSGYMHVLTARPSHKPPHIAIAQAFRYPSTSISVRTRITSQPVGRGRCNPPRRETCAQSRCKATGRREQEATTYGAKEFSTWSSSLGPGEGFLRRKRSVVLVGLG